jgi:hypothetical protein
LVPKKISDFFQELIGPPFVGTTNKSLLRGSQLRLQVAVHGRADKRRTSGFRAFRIRVNATEEVIIQ